jgi:hypothetical protein
MSREYYPNRCVSTSLTSRVPFRRSGREKQSKYGMVIPQPVLKDFILLSSMIGSVVHHKDVAGPQESRCHRVLHLHRKELGINSRLCDSVFHGRGARVQSPSDSVAPPKAVFCTRSNLQQQASSLPLTAYRGNNIPPLCSRIHHSTEQMRAGPARPHSSP